MKHLAKIYNLKILRETCFVIKISSSGVVTSVLELFDEHTADRVLFASVVGGWII